MEYIMDPGMAWQLKFVCNRTNLLQNFIGTIILRPKLGMCVRCDPHCCSLLKFQPDPITFLKQHFPSFFIFILLHCDLGLNETPSNINYELISSHQLLIYCRDLGGPMLIRNNGIGISAINNLEG
jgi:hypothetical protein